MKRHVFALATAFLSVVLTSGSAIAQASKSVEKAAPQAAPAPPAPAKWVKPVKGLATIDVIQTPSKYSGKEIITNLKVKNTSSGAIALLKVEEFWYDKDLKIVTGDASAPIRKPINPGEIVEITLKSPFAPNLYRSRYAFTHANGEVKATQVKEFK